MKHVDEWILYNFSGEICTYRLNWVSQCVNTLSESFINCNLMAVNEFHYIIYIK